MKTGAGKSPVLVASLWMLGMVVSLSTIAIGGRELSAHMNPFEMVFFRGVFGILVLTPLVLYHFGRIPQTSRLKIHVFRNIFHFLGQSAWFFGIMLLPLAKVFAIEFTTPMWTILLAAILLGEKITRWRVVSLLLGLVGVAIVLRPGIISIETGTFVVLGSALFFALSHIFTRKLTASESPLCILFYMSAVQVPISLLPATLVWVTPAGTDWLWLALLGICSITAHYCLSRALTLADAGLMIPIDFLRLPLIVIVGYLFYQEALDVFVLLGASVIFAGNFLNVRHEHRRLNQSPVL